MPHKNIDLPREDVRNTNPAALRRYPKAVHREPRDGRRLTDDVFKGRTVAPRDGRRLNEQHPGRLPLHVRRDNRRLGRDGPYDATSKIEAKRVFDAEVSAIRKQAGLEEQAAVNILRAAREARVLEVPSPAPVVKAVAPKPKAKKKKKGFFKKLLGGD